MAAYLALLRPRARPKPPRAAAGEPACVRMANAAGSNLGLRLENLAPAIKAGLGVAGARAAQFARILVFDIGRGLEGVGGAAHAAPRRRGLLSWHGHGIVLLELFGGAPGAEDAGGVRKRGL